MPLQANAGPAQAPNNVRAMLMNASLGRRPTDHETAAHAVELGNNKDAIVAVCQQAAMEYTYGRTATARTLATDAITAYSIA